MLCRLFISSDEFRPYLQLWTLQLNQRLVGLRWCKKFLHFTSAKDVPALNRLHTPLYMRHGPTWQSWPPSPSWFRHGFQHSNMGQTRITQHRSST